MATEPSTGRWMPHWVFDGDSTCPGEIVIDLDALEAGDHHVIVECDACGYAAAVPRAEIERTAPLPPRHEWPDRWWDR